MCVCVCSENICIFHSAAANTVQQSCRQRRLIFPLTLGIEKSYWDGSFNRCIYKLFRVHEKLLDKTTSSGFRQRLSNFPTANFRVCLRYKELHLNSCTWWMAYRPQNESILVVSSGLTFENAFSIDFSYFLFRSTLKSNSRLFAPVATPTVHWYFSRRRYCCFRFGLNAAAEHFHFPFFSLRKRRRQLRPNVLNKLCETERNEWNSNFGREFATYFPFSFPG